MKVYFATDHRGFELKEFLIPFVQNLGYDIEDLGAYEHNEVDDYPDYIKKIEKMGEDDKAIILGGSGQGEAMVANRIKGIRAAVVYSQHEDIIRLSREHNDANVLSLGANFISTDEAKNIVEMWLKTEFSGDERHIRRINKIDNG